MTQPVVEVRGVTKSYGAADAVRDVSFRLEEGKIYGLLGRNGAGKTTLMQMITAQQFPTQGDVLVFGEQPYENNGVLSRICFIKESQKYPDPYKVKDVFKVAASFFPDWDVGYALELAADFRLPLDKKVKKLSRGMLSSVGIIVGLASRAPLTIFDEPYLGLDAVARSLFYNRLLEDYAEHPRTILLSTHLIDEVSMLLEHVLVIDGGRLLLDEDAEALRGRAFAIAGRASSVDAFTAGRKVLHREPLGALVTATVLGALRPEERSSAAELGLETAPVSLQQLIIHLTNGSAAKKEESR